MAKSVRTQAGKAFAPAPPARGLSLHLPRWLAGAFTAGMVLPWVLVGLIWLHAPALGLAGHDGASLPASARIQAGGPGPWGDLEIVPIRIAPPLEYIPELSWAEPNWRWVFQGMTVGALRDFLAELEMTPALREEMLSTATVVPEAGGCAVTPAAQTVRALPLEARRRIYLRLRGRNLNPDQEDAFRVPVSEWEERLAAMDVAGPIRDLVRQTSFPQGRYRFFGDLRLALTLLPDVTERTELVTSLAQTSTFLVRLRVGKDADVRALAAYWGRGGRGKDIEPLLESLARQPQGPAIDVMHLLPGFARRRVYTFPRPTHDPAERLHDCHWTALNFLNEQPDDRLAGPQVYETIRTGYMKIHGHPMLGDLVLFAKRDGQLLHSAVYIADDILFTKNGPRNASPFVFMRLEDVRDFYPGEVPLDVHYVRRNELMGD